jgi:preprotein translocase subunit SecE
LRQPPSRPGAKREGGAGLASWRPRFLTDIITELRKVVWPSRQDTIHLTIVVVIVAIIMGALLGSIDVGFGWIIDRVLLN